MTEAEKIHGPLAAGEEGLQRGCGSVFGKVPEKGVACAEGQEPKSDAVVGGRGFEGAVQDFVSRAIAADREEAAVALLVRFASQLDGMARTGGGYDVNPQPLFAQACEGGPGKLCRAAATRGGVDDGEKPFFQGVPQIRWLNDSSYCYKGRNAVARSSFASCSASTFLLILSEAVRGKSCSNSTTP